ncbi:hypothetical protein MESS4_20076 [Mesorhizobium sp. STM 4661]|nr:hypothetical protein MESS4_20076 [Mesorhizobium sp. STM 4661]
MMPTRPLLKQLQRHQDGRAGHPIKRVAVAYEAAGEGFWLARWLRAHGIEAYAFQRAFLGWLRRAIARRAKPLPCAPARAPSCPCRWHCQ